MHWLLAILILPYFILLLRIFRNLAGIMPDPPYGPANNFVSVVIACKNEEKNLSVILNDIASQDYGQDNYELIIVNDNSTDGTYEAATRFGCIRHLKIINNEGHGKKSAVVTGVAASSGDLLLTTDADCRMEKTGSAQLQASKIIQKRKWQYALSFLKPVRAFFKNSRNSNSSACRELLPVQQPQGILSCAMEPTWHLPKPRSLDNPESSMMNYCPEMTYFFFRG